MLSWTANMFVVSTMIAKESESSLHFESWLAAGEKDSKYIKRYVTEDTLLNHPLPRMQALRRGVSAETTL